MFAEFADDVVLWITAALAILGFVGLSTAVALGVAEAVVK